jgi:hypothetical protein
VQGLPVLLHCNEVAGGTLARAAKTFMIGAILAQTMVIHDIAQGRQAGRIEIRVAQSRARLS